MDSASHLFWECLEFVLSLGSLAWQVHVHQESLTEKALVRFSISFLNDDKDILAFDRYAKNHFSLEMDPAALNKNELSAEVVNIGQRPLYIKNIRLVAPCPETQDSDSVDFQPVKGSPLGALESGASVIYKSGSWDLSKHPLSSVNPSESFCVTVESNKGVVIAQTGEISQTTFRMNKRLRSKYEHTPVVRKPE